jgi:repressor LexA
MLTRKQHELLIFIDDYLGRTGTSPSFEEMKDALHARSKGSIHRLITALEERGFLARRHHRARALAVLCLPENLASRNRRAGATGFVRTGAARHPVSSGFTGSAGELRTANHSDAIQVPLHGRIAAGFAVEAPHASGEHLAVPAALLADAGHEHYALEVAGDSMIEAGILEGDMVIIRRDAAVDSGKIAVASVAGHATLKRIFHYGNEIALQPDNVRYPTQVFPAGMVTVQGELVALLRRYYTSPPKG